MSDLTPPASLADPHRSLNRSVKGIFAGLHRTVDAYDGEGDIIEVAKAALASAGHELAALLDQREIDNAAYVAKMEAQAQIDAAVQDAHVPSPDSVELTDQAQQIEQIAPTPAPTEADATPAEEPAPPTDPTPPAA